MKRFLSILCVWLTIAGPVWAQTPLKQSTAVTVKLGPFVDDDGITAATGLTLSQADFRLSKNGGDMAQKNESSSATHDELGVYDVALNTTDTNTLGILRVDVGESGTLPYYRVFVVLPANVYDSLYGSDKLETDLVQINGQTTPVGQLEEAFDNDNTGGDLDLSTLRVTSTTAFIGATTVTGDVTHDGALILNKGLNISQSASNAAAVTLNGNGTGPGLEAYSGSGAAAHAVIFGATSTNGDALRLVKAGTGVDLRGNITGNLTGTVSGNVGGIAGTITTLDALDTAQDSQHTTTQSAITSIDGLVDSIYAFLDGAPTFGEAMDDQGYTGALATQLETNVDAQISEIEAGGGGDSAQLLQSTTIATLTNQTVFTLTAGSADNDAYNGAMAVITDQSTSTQKSFVPVSDYVGSTKQVTLGSTPKFTIATGDGIKIVAVKNPLLSPFDASRRNTWRFDSDRQITAPNRVVLPIPFDGVAKFDISEVLPDNDSIESVSSVSISPTAGDEPDLGTAAVMPDKDAILIPIDTNDAGDPCDTGTYTITVTYVTEGDQTDTKKGILVVQ